MCANNPLHGLHALHIKSNAKTLLKQDAQLNLILFLL